MEHGNFLSLHVWIWFLSGDPFEITLKVLPGQPLPTKPKLRVYGVIGFPNTASTAMRRFDHAPFFSMQQDEYTIPFYVKNDFSEEALLEKKKFLNNPMR